MKKSLLALILAVALVAPVFAQKGDKSINAKLGLGVNNDLSMNYDELEKWSYSVFCIRYIKGKRGTHPWQKQKDHS